MSYADRDRQIAYCREWRGWYAEHGICIKCHEADAEPGHVHCKDCLQAENVRKSYTRVRDNAKRKKLREDRLAKGLCPYCGNKATEGMKSCARCRAMRNDCVRKHRIIFKIEKEAERARNGR